MLTFSQFLKEAGDTTLPFKYDGSFDAGDDEVYHRYSFNHEGNKYNTFLTHKNRPKPHVSVSFSQHMPSGRWTYWMTNKSGPSAIKVMSTVHNIVKHHLAKHPEIKEVRFTSDGDEPSRAKLYTRYAEKHGGHTKTSDEDEHIHIIPAQSYRMSESFLNEAGDSTLPFKYDGQPFKQEHRYSFKYDDHPYKVIIDHDDHPNKAAVVQFVRLLPHNHGTAKLTSDARHAAIKILSTMHNIVKHHVSQHPEIKEVHFSSDSSEPSRVKLYTRYTEKHNGYTEPDKYDTHHVIPARSYKMTEGFIIEAGDTALPFHYDGEDRSVGEEHAYSFKHNGAHYTVMMDHGDYPIPYAIVQFGQSPTQSRDIGITKLTSDSGPGVHKIMSTIHNIVKHHVKEHPHLKKVTFTSSSDEPSRVKLYKKYTDKLGGTTTHANSSDQYNHEIPADSYRRINESEDQPVRIQLGKPKGEQAHKFIVDFVNDSDEHPFNPAARILHGAVVHASRDGNQVHLHDIQTLAPKSGAGTKALKHLTSLADKHGVKLNLFAKAYSNRPEHIRSTPKLIKWYERHGFKHDEPDYDPHYGSEMTYYPK